MRPTAAPHLNKKREEASFHADPREKKKKKKRIQGRVFKFPLVFHLETPIYEDPTV
jgi:hypothetical protein